MSIKIDWNDMSDDDSQGAHQVVHEQHHEKQLIEVPVLNKKASSTLVQNKNSSNQQENLRRLQSCPRQDVWLYVPLFYRQNVEEVDQMLRKHLSLKTIQKFSKGWNVYTKKDYAKAFICQGHKQNKLLLRFYFSNKNDQSTKNYNKHRVNDDYTYENKKTRYVAKQPNNRPQKKDERSSQHIRKDQNQKYYEISGAQNPKGTSYKNQSKNLKYKQKETIKSSNSKEKQFSNEGSRNLRPKFVKKDDKQQRSYKAEHQNYVESPKKKYTAKVKQEPKKQEQQPFEASSSVKKIQTIDMEDNQESQPTRNSPSQKKPKKKKTKKEQFLNDSNNPYSMLRHL